MSQPFGVFLQCHKQPYATYSALSSVRKYYPNCTIVLLSDNGYNYQKMANHFNATYIHDTENLWLSWREFESGGHIPNSHKLIHRTAEAFKLCPEEYVMWLEDDVSINGPIMDTFKYDVNGYCPNRFLECQIKKLKVKYPFLKLDITYRFSGHGGSVFHKNNLLKFFENKEALDDVLKNWLYYEFPLVVGHDYLFSLMVLLGGGTIGPYQGHADGFNGIQRHITVQHQYKSLYNIPAPPHVKELYEEKYI
jgi:hypothetical protein